MFTSAKAVLVGWAAIVLVCGCATSNPPLPDVRRIVTVENDDGAAVVMADDAGGNELFLNGSRIVRLWETNDTPVSLTIDGDAGQRAGNAYRPGFSGTSFYLAELPAGSDLDDIPLHQQDSLDYIAVLEGEIVLVLPDQRLRMRRGDTLVQAGNVHSWVNDTDATCRLLVVVLSGERHSDPN